MYPGSATRQRSLRGSVYAQRRRSAVVKYSSQKVDEFAAGLQLHFVWQRDPCITPRITWASSFVGYVASSASLKRSPLRPTNWRASSTIYSAHEKPTTKLYSTS